MKEDFKLMNLKGTNDFLPEEQIIRNKIINVLRNTFESYGFLPLETPVLCYYDLLASKYAGGAEILKEVYKLTDQGDREIGLRYDLTVPFSKVIGMNKGLILPFKRYEIGKVFRDGPVKLGRAREFYQCDVDACGTESPYAEIEYFMMTRDVFKKLNINVEIRYNNRKFLSGLLEYCGVLNENISSFILSVDKLDKISRQDIEEELIKHTSKDIIDKVFEYFDKSLEELNAAFDNLNDNLREGLYELNQLNKFINDLELNELCVFTPFLARGLEIYTGTVWEVFDSSLNFKSALGGGGRYDKIITNFLNDGNTYPAIGCSFGLEPMYELLKDKEKESLNKYDVYVYAFDNDYNLFKISDLLRKGGYKVLTELNNIKLKKAMNIANREKIKKVIILGEDELKENSVTVKNMDTGNQEKVLIEELLNKINEI